MTRKSLGLVLLSSCSGLVITLAANASALPSGGHFASGKGEIGKAGQSLTVKQSSTTGIVDWSSFSVGKHESVTFDNGSGATLNRVTGDNLSRMAGSLHATGSLYLLNSAGVIVSGTGHVVTGGNFVTSSGNIADGAFGTEDQRLRGAHAAVVNRGSIVSGGDASLVGGSVKNVGTITASSVNLRAMYGQAVGGGAVDAIGSSSQGGHILLIAASGMTKVTGDLVARNAGGSGGSIETSGRHLSIAGRIDAGEGGTWLVDPVNLTIDSSAAITIDTSLNAGTSVMLKTAKKSASGPGNQSSGAGDIIVDSALSWSSTAKLTLDAYHSVLIDAAMGLTGKGKLALLTNDGGTGGSLAFGGGDVTFANTASALTINGVSYTLVNNIAALASDIAKTPSGDFALAGNFDASNGGSGGSGYSTAPVPTTFTGIFEGLGNTISNLSINSGNTNVGLFATIGAGGTIADLDLENVSVVSTSSALNTAVGALAATNDGTVRGDTVSGSVTATGDIGSNSGATQPIQVTNVGGLIGVNEGLIYTSSSSAELSVPNGTSANVGGLVGYGEGADSSVTDSYATGTVTALGLTVQDGGLIGWSEGIIANSYAIGSVVGASEGDYGGLAGYSQGTLINSYATGAVAITGGNGADLGGLVGGNGGNISNSYATGTVSNGKSTMTTWTVYAGGFLGFNAGTVEHSYSTGAVIGSNQSRDGGFAGVSNGTINESYSFGKVTVSKGSIAAGFAGENDNSSGISSSVGDYYNKTANTGAAVGVESENSDVHGLSATAMFKASSFTEWTDFDVTPGASGWVIADVDGSLNNAGNASGGTLPVLLSEYSTTITNAHQLQLMALDLTADYALAGDIDAFATAGGDVWGAAGFIPIGGNVLTAGYTGTFDGDGHTINGLFIDYNTSTTTGSWAGEAGLFGFVDAPGIVENVGMTNASVVVGNRMNAGILVGNLSGSVLNSYSTGSSSTGAAIKNKTPGAGDAGGLVGAVLQAGLVDDCYSSATVVAGGSSIAGGLAGGLYSGGTVENSYATGSVTTGNDILSGMYLGPIAGGLIGLVYSDPSQGGTINTVTDDYATGMVGVGNAGGAGGLIGTLEGSGTVSLSYATGSITVGTGDSSTTGYSFAGGLIGLMTRLNGGTNMLDQSYATGNVTGAAQSLDGGLVGDVTTTITDSYATGAVFAGGSGSAFSIGGGLVGNADSGSSISTSYATSAVTGTSAQLGGFAGAATSAIFKNDYWDMTASGIGADNGVGGVTDAAGVTGDTTKQLKAKLPKGFNSSVWAIDPGVNSGLPYLKALADTL